MGLLYVSTSVKFIGNKGEYTLQLEEAISRINSGLIGFINCIS